MSLVRLILIVLGTLSLCVGLIGIVVPGLPTTPFILLTAGLYVRSSDRLYQGLIRNRFIGPYIKEFRMNKGMSIYAKWTAIGVMWMMILISCIFFIDSPAITMVVLVTGTVGTVVMGFVIPTIKPANRRKP